MDQVRTALQKAIDASPHNLTDLSLVIGRNKAYLQQFLERGTPRRLDDLDRRHLAIYLNLDERLLGAREPFVPRPDA